MQVSCHLRFLDSAILSVEVKQTLRIPTSRQGANPIKGFLPMPRRKNKWLEKEKESVAAIPLPVPVVAPITAQYLNIEQASAYLSVTTWTIRRLIDNKELSCAKIGKRFIIKREDLDNIWEKRQKIGTGVAA